MEVKAIGEPCGFNGNYTFYKGLQIISSGNKNNLNITNSTVTINLPTSSSTTQLNKNKPMTRKCVVDRRNEKLNNCNLAIFQQLVLTLGDFIPVKPWSDSHIACLAEIRMIWRDKNEHSLLTGLRLYFLPENTPLGRNCHGEDEVLAISDKVVIRAEDLLNWFDEKLEWNWGLGNTRNRTDVNQSSENESTQIKEDKEYIFNMKFSSSLKNSQIDFSDVQIEKRDGDKFTSNITVLSYPRYCRFRATLKRLEGVTDGWLKNSVVAALCGFTGMSSNYRVMFCRDTFDYPELETHELLCNHLAPKLKGRRRKLFGRADSPFSGTKKGYESATDSNESDISLFSVGNEKVFLQSQQPRTHLRCNYRSARGKVKFESNLNQKVIDDSKISTKINSGHDKTCKEKTEFLRANNRTTRFRSHHLSGKKLTEDISKSNQAEEKFFLRKLHEFHIRKNNEISQMLWLSLKDIHLYSIFRQVKKLGGYEAVTSKKLWKNLFGEKNLPHLMITRRKYAKLLLPLEQSDVFTKNTSLIKSTYIETPSANKLVPVKSEKTINLKVKIKDEISENFNLKNDAVLNTDEMAEIQSKLKSKMALSSRKDVISGDDVKFVTTVNSTASKISVPVTVIVGTTQDSKAIISSSTEKKSIVSSNPTTTGKNLSKKFQIQQPHTTITVHQTTIHPHANSNKITNKIQITNQIQIQQITVQPSRTGLSSVEINNHPSDLRCNISKNPDTQLIKIEGNHFSSHNLKQNIRVKTDEDILKESIPFIAPGTTITPVLSTPSIQPATLDLKKFSPNVDIENLTATNTSISSLSSSKSSIINSRTRMISLNQDVFSPFKRRKLDILREGGLEVTAISNKHGVISSSVPLSIPKLNRSSERTSKFNLSSMLDVSLPNTIGLNIKKPQVATNSMYTKTDKIFGNPKDIFHDSVSLTSSKEKKMEEVLDLTIHRSRECSTVGLQGFHKFNELSTTPPPLNLSTEFITPKIPKLSENGLQITLVPASQQMSLFQPLTYTQNVHNSQNHNMKRKAVDSVHTARSEINTRENKKLSPDGTSSTNLSPSAKPPIPFPTFIPNIAAVAAASHHEYLPMYLSNLYGQAPNLFLSNQIPQELLEFYENLPADLGMIPVTKS